VRLTTGNSFQGPSGSEHALGTDACDLTPLLRVPTDRCSQFVTAPSPGLRDADRGHVDGPPTPSAARMVAGNVRHKLALVAQHYRPLSFFLRDGSALQDRSHAHAASCANGNQPSPCALLRQELCKRRHDACSCCSERVTDCDAAAFDVELAAID